MPLSEAKMPATTVRALEELRSGRHAFIKWHLPLPIPSSFVLHGYNGILGLFNYRITRIKLDNIDEVELCSFKRIGRKRGRHILVSSENPTSKPMLAVNVTFDVHNYGHYDGDILLLRNCWRYGVLDTSLLSPKFAGVYLNWADLKTIRREVMGVLF